MITTPDYAGPNYAGWAATAWAAILFGVHTFEGGAQVAVPLAQSDLPASVLAPALMVWNMMTGLLALLTLMFAYATVRRARDAALAAFAMAVVISAMGLVSIPLTGVTFWQLPQGALFVPLAVFGYFTCRKV